MTSTTKDLMLEGGLMAYYPAVSVSNITFNRGGRGGRGERG